ncbi:MAG: DUF2877 domain-containing protein [Hyphomicrobiales bacterium]|nr:DUF2877 domain-containing protein [Hyphomicrobiales bacterium]
MDAVFERVCLITLDDGSMIALLGNGVGNVAHGIRLAGAHRLDRYFARGALAHVASDRITLGDGAVTVLLARARTWRPRFPGAEICEPRTRPGVMRLCALLGHAGHGSDLLAATSGASHRQTALTAIVAPLLPQLAAATRQHDADCALRLAAQLIGLGGGLTPAGDDFLIGWLAGLTLTAASPRQTAFLQAIRQGLGALRHATTAVSAQHLADACALMFSEHLSELCLALAENAPSTVLAPRVAAQLAVGATSGADAAAGLLFALRDCAPEQ